MYGPLSDPELVFGPDWTRQLQGSALVQECSATETLPKEPPVAAVVDRPPRWLRRVVLPPATHPIDDTD
ncbi:hypothetical protein KRM28CT15_25860 [Krasilnikovia sp. M28-CT-15]